ncbi:MAG: hypothetical protein NC833_03260 [Candidatus Omnitrophica bacterium]|nr:hypothetical protein [Candidatus Omnitrophota bacterium]
MLKLIKKIIVFFIMFGIIGAGWLFYNKYRIEKLKRLAEEEKRRQEEIEKERQRKLIEEKRKFFDEFVSEIEVYFKERKDYEKVKKLIEEAIRIAKQYNFPVDRIEKILYQIKVDTYISQLKKLEKENEDIYKYFYVRSEVQKIPSLKEIMDLKNKIIKKTYENEYKVKLLIAKNLLKENEDISYNYFLSRRFYSNSNKLRKREDIKKDKLEEEIEELQNDLYFVSENLYKNTIPSSIY